MNTAISGHVSPGFEDVAKAFAANISTSEIGAACAVRVRGELVLNVWGGMADADAGKPWTSETITPVFSVTKGVAAVVVAHLAGNGLIDLDAPLARYWPEFAAHGKGSLSVRRALAHQAGVPFIDGSITLADLGSPAGMAARLAAQEPMFEPGSAHAYHAVTVGWITSELVRRVTGRPIGAWLSENIATPLGLSTFIGLPEVERSRVARLRSKDPAAMQALVAAFTEGTAAWKAMTLNGSMSLPPEGLLPNFNDYAVQSVELAGANMITDALSLATLYAACVGEIGGVRLLSDATISDATRPISTGPQYGVQGPEPSWAAGFMTPWEIQPMLGPESFGHDGFGGSLGFADPAYRVGFGYVRNGLVVGGVRDPEVYNVVDALRAALGRTA